MLEHVFIIQQHGLYSTNSLTREYGIQTLAENPAWEFIFYKYTFLNHISTLLRINTFILKMHTEHHITLNKVSRSLPMKFCTTAGWKDFLTLS